MATNPFSEFLSGVKKLWFVSTGAAADNATASGNPVLVGGRYSATPATRHDGDVATIETDSQGRVLTVVSSRNVEVVNVFNAMAITDTTNHGGTLVDVSKYKSVQISVISTLNQEVSVTVYDANYGATYWNGTAWVPMMVKLTQSGASKILNTIFPALNSSPYPINVLGKPQVNIFAQCTVAPTAGSLTINVLGVPN